METAKIFWSGHSQAVRLPRKYQFDGNKVRIRRHGEAVVLEPIPSDWRWLDALIETIDVNFRASITETETADVQQRNALDLLFR